MKKNPIPRALGGAAKHDAGPSTESLLETNPAPPRSRAYLDAPETLDMPPGHVAEHKGRFRILRPHAEGGLGRVFVAYDTEVGREIALKEIKPDKADDFDSRDRFTREAEITGNLEHPGVVPVYGQGSDTDGRPYYAMRFIRGISLRDAIDAYHGRADDSRVEDANVSYTFDLRRLVKRLIDVCQTMQYAHSRGVLHRDLKPSNVMLGPYGETLVVDWGLAKASGEASVDLAADLGNSVSKASLPEFPVIPHSHESQPTLVGSAVGTPAYMSPEQAQGRIDLLCPASDVFSLGAILYQILTGRPPYQSRATSDTLRLARDGKYARPRASDPTISRALEAICLKAMDPAMTRRYASAALLARDLDCYLADEPISAYRPRLMERVARWIRRHKTKAAAVAISMLAVVVAAIAIAAVSLGYSQVLSKTNSDLAKAKTEAESEADRAKKAEAQALGLNEFVMSMRKTSPETPVGEVVKQYLEELRRRATQQSSEPPE